ncbi:flagellar biosynthetic protein FliR [Novosphingobium sp. B 225]|uniref:flagellar biosynthetic protein FliR n=1 Tax=Novosphingobium sp. B 225 TaxID=1961849 RepID=UPI000B4B4F19|nr:flagellar biosynthetic protein FliR [Novosphingobium sp. B 225]
MTESGADALAIWVASSLLLTLRIAPTLMFAPPFTLIRVPRTILAMLGLTLAAVLVSANPAARLAEVTPAVLATGAISELLAGLIPLIALQLMFAALYLVGRTIDIQSGFGLALLIDPGTRAQTPLVGTFFAYIAGVTFFAMDGHLALLRFWSASLSAVPLGGVVRLGGVGALGEYMLTTSLIALGIGGAAILGLFLTDVVIAMASRTVPQLNALLLGIQVKAILVLALLPIAFGTSAALYVQLVASALSFMQRTA